MEVADLAVLTYRLITDREEFIFDLEDFTEALMLRPETNLLLCFFIGLIIGINLGTNYFRYSFKMRKRTQF